MHHKPLYCMPILIAFVFLLLSDFSHSAEAHPVLETEQEQRQGITQHQTVEPPPGLQEELDIPLYTVRGDSDVITITQYGTFVVYVSPTDGDLLSRSQVRWSYDQALAIEIERYDNDRFGTNVLTVSIAAGGPGAEANVRYADGRTFVIRIEDPQQVALPIQVPQDLNAPTPTPTIMPTETPWAPQVEMLDICSDPPLVEETGPGQVLLVARQSTSPLVRLDTEDGTQTTLVTDVATDYYSPDTVAWSPDGAQIASVEEETLYIFDAAGNNRRQLTDLDVVESAPTWSPDGKWLAFSAHPPRDPQVMTMGRGSAEIYLIRVDGSDLRRLTDDKRHDIAPHWSPDGQKLVFTSEPVPPGASRRGQGNVHLVILDLRANQKTQLTDEFADSIMPAWSSDGKKLAFILQFSNSSPQYDYYSPSSGQYLYVVNADGTELKQITPDILSVTRPSWSSDSLWIAFSAIPQRKNLPQHYGYPPLPVTSAVYLIKPDGSCWQPVIEGDERHSHEVNWSPDDSQLIVHTYRNIKFRERISLNDAIQLLDIGTKALTPLWEISDEGRNRTPFTLPKWRPLCAVQKRICMLPILNLDETLLAHDYTTAPVRVVSGETEVDSEEFASQNEEIGLMEPTQNEQATVPIVKPVTYSSTVTVPIPNISPSMLNAADLDQDGITDLIINGTETTRLTEQETAAIFFGNKDGTFVKSAQYYGFHVYPELFGDLNNDTYLDFVVPNVDSPMLTVLFGNADGTFYERDYQLLADSTSAIAVADVNHDLTDELVVFTINQMYSSPSFSITVYTLNNPDNLEALTKTAIILRGVPRLIDLDNDGNLDLTYQGEMIFEIFYGNEKGSFPYRYSRHIDAPLQTIYKYPLQVFDMNGDNVLDILVDPQSQNPDTQTYEINLILSTGNRAYDEIKTISLSNQPDLVHVTDIDGNGIGDMLVATQNPSAISLLLNPGTTETSLPIMYPLGDVEINHMTFADVNGDTIPDLLAYLSEPEDTLQVWLSGIPSE